MQQRFCGRCGRELDLKTGLCPSCDADKIKAPREKKKDKTKETKKTTSGRKKPVLIIIVCVAVVALIIGGFFLFKERPSGGSIFTDLFGSGNDSDDSDIDRTSHVRATYVTYLSDIVAEKGVLDTDNPKENPEGVCAAEIVDLDGDETDEMVLVYKEKNNEDDIDTKIVCISYLDEADEDAGQSVVSSEGFTIPVSSAWCEEFFYAVTFEGKKYFIYEHLGKGDDYYYEAHAFTVTDGHFEDAANVFSYGLSSDPGSGVSYCMILPPNQTIDNSDLDRSYEDFWEFTGSDGAILYYYNYGDDDDVFYYEYNRHFSSQEDSIVWFLKCFGVEKDVPFRYSLVKPKDVDFIYTYSHYWVTVYDSGKRIETFEFNDYSDLQSLLEEKVNIDTEEQTVNTPSEGFLRINFEELMEDADEKIVEIGEYSLRFRSNKDDEGFVENYVLSVKSLQTDNYINPVVLDRDGLVVTNGSMAYYVREYDKLYQYDLLRGEEKIVKATDEGEFEIEYVYGDYLYFEIYEDEFDEYDSRMLVCDLITGSVSEAQSGDGRICEALGKYVLTENYSDETVDTNVSELWLNEIEEDGSLKRTKQMAKRFTAFSGTAVIDDKFWFSTATGSIFSVAPITYSTQRIFDLGTGYVVERIYSDKCIVFSTGKQGAWNSAYYSVDYSTGNKVKVDWE